ncbi:ribonuclease E inhibitor RraB [Limnoglobus roseus]|uniref:Regulator of ribonuclease activity B domain-containing protein n=1 Tax=Limnoglobus roseus TaxID=2598579 RepID=A0A5C1ASE1_9BACT|nr:ribonuclease E inhibitor RraB [Limnoglobus roseus]QEL19818.1 hypothetical protein PX52LOC_06899 [Limnoglobus roseus]
MPLPTDSIGNQLRDYALAGFDLSLSHTIYFDHHFDARGGGVRMAARVQGETVASIVDDSEGAWQVRCYLTAVPTHTAITETEAKLGRIAEACGGMTDGWEILVR